jgi:hypothetical protein
VILVDNDINVNDPVTWSTPQNLTLDAGRNVNINAAITAITASTAGAQLILIGGNDVSISGAITASGSGNQINVTAGSNIVATGVITANESNTELNMTAGQDITAGTVTTDGGGSMVLSANRNITIDTASAAAGSGTVSLFADSDGSGPGVGGGTVILGTGVTATNTIIRFNPETYAATSTEIGAYNDKIVGPSDIKAWVFTLADNKVYDATTAATLSFVGAPTDASAVTLDPGTATFDNKNVGDDKVVTYAGYSLGGVTTNLELFSTAGTHLADITPAPLNVTVTGIDKVYDAMTTATVTLAATVLASDDVTLANTAANFIDKNVGTNKTVNVAGISIAGADAGNYLANTTTATTADITAATLIISATGSDKVFDGSTTATVMLSDNRIAGDLITTSNTSANFDSPLVGNDKAILVAGISTAGTDAGNYTYNTTTTTFANITPDAATSDQVDRAVAVVPVTPLSSNDQAPIVLRKDTQYGGITATPILPLVLLGATTPAVSGIEKLV